jgi:hypothetical protein
MQIRAGEEDVYARPRCAFQGRPCAANIGLSRPGKTCDHGTAYLAGDGFYGFKVVVRGDGKSSFDNVSTQSFELASQPKLVADAHTASGRLLAIAQGCIKEGNA